MLPSDRYSDSERHKTGSGEVSSHIMDWGNFNHDDQYLSSVNAFANATPRRVDAFSSASSHSTAAGSSAIPANSDSSTPVLSSYPFASRDSRPSSAQHGVQHNGSFPHQHFSSSAFSTSGASDAQSNFGFYSYPTQALPIQGAHIPHQPHLGHHHNQSQQRQHQQSQQHQQGQQAVTRPLSGSSVSSSRNGASAGSSAAGPLFTIPHGRIQGMCKWFDADKGYGFIADRAFGDIFVHQSEIRSLGFRTLETEELVSYEIVPDPRTGKLKAINVASPDGGPVYNSFNPRHMPPGGPQQQSQQQGAPVPMQGGQQQQQQQQQQHSLGRSGSRNSGRLGQSQGQQQQTGGMGTSINAAALAAQLHSLSLHAAGSSNSAAPSAQGFQAAAAAAAAVGVTDPTAMQAFLQAHIQAQLQLQQLQKQIPSPSAQSEQSQGQGLRISPRADSDLQQGHGHLTSAASSPVAASITPSASAAAAGAQVMHAGGMPMTGDMIMHLTAALRAAAAAPSGPATSSSDRLSLPGSSMDAPVSPAGSAAGSLALSSAAPCSPNAASFSGSAAGSTRIDSSSPAVGGSGSSVGTAPEGSTRQFSSRPAAVSGVVGAAAMAPATAEAVGSV